MKRAFLLIGVLIFIYAGTLQASPIMFDDTILFYENSISSGTLNDFGWGDVNKLDGCFDYVYWTHVFSFDPPVETILYGSLVLNITDDAEGGTCWNPESDANDGLFGSEYTFMIGEDGTFILTEVDTDEYGFELDVSCLYDGYYSFLLISKFGDFLLNSSNLSVEYSPVAAPVPEPSTILLLGMGLLSAGLISRKRFLKK